VRGRRFLLVRVGLEGVSLAALLLHEAVLPIQAVGGTAILAVAILVQRQAPAAAPELGIAVAERT
jgi:hypothetical protein